MLRVAAQHNDDRQSIPDTDNLSTRSTVRDHHIDSQASRSAWKKISPRVDKKKEGGRTKASAYHKWAAALKSEVFDSKQAGSISSTTGLDGAGPSRAPPAPEAVHDPEILAKLQEMTAWMETQQQEKEQERQAKQERHDAQQERWTILQTSVNDLALAVQTATEHTNTIVENVTDVLTKQEAEHANRFEELAATIEKEHKTIRERAEPKRLELREFTKALATEVRMLVGEVGKLREERRSLQFELGTLLSVKHRFNNEGDLVGQVNPPKQSSGPPPPPPPPPVRAGSWQTWSKSPPAPVTFPVANVDIPEPGLFGPKSPTGTIKGIPAKPRTSMSKGKLKPSKTAESWGSSATIVRPVPRRRGSSVGPTNKHVHFSPQILAGAGPTTTRRRSSSDASWPSPASLGWGVTPSEWGGPPPGWAPSESEWSRPPPGWTPESDWSAPESDWGTAGPGWGESPDASTEHVPPPAPAAPPKQPAEPSPHPAPDRLSPIADFQTKADFNLTDNAEPPDILDLTPTEQQHAIRFPTLEPVVLSPRPTFGAPRPVPFLVNSIPILRSSPEPQIETLPADRPRTEKQPSPKDSPSKSAQDTGADGDKKPENGTSKTSQPVSPQPPLDKPNKGYQKPSEASKIPPWGATNLAADAKNYLHDFTAAIANEARLLANEVGKLREERKTHQDELAFLLTIQSKYGPGGEFEPDWRPSYLPLKPPQAPAPPAPEPPDIPPPAKPGWRTIQGRRPPKRKPIAPPPLVAPPPPPDPRRQVLSWAEWRPDPSMAPTPPSVEPTLLVPPRGSPGLFGPRSPRGSFDK